jgi:hypothetical protein
VLAVEEGLRGGASPTAAAAVVGGGGPVLLKEQELVVEPEPEDNELDVGEEVQR